MASNVRMRIAAGATVLGLGGLAGYALATNDGQSAAAEAPAQDPKPKVRTEVVHRTIHVRAKDGSEAGAGGAASGSSPAPGSPGSVVTPVTDTSGYAAPSTGSSGSSSSDERDEHGDDEGEHESDDDGEHESDGGDD